METSYMIGTVFYPTGTSFIMNDLSNTLQNFGEDENLENTEDWISRGWIMRLSWTYRISFQLKRSIGFIIFTQLSSFLNFTKRLLAVKNSFMNNCLPKSKTNFLSRCFMIDTIVLIVLFGTYGVLLLNLAFMILFGWL